jgi:WD40 repeat protein
MQVFQTSSRAVLRQLKAHQRPVHVARFSPDKLHVVSASDDATVCTGVQPRTDGRSAPLPPLQ